MADGKVVISTELDNSGVEEGVEEISGSLGGLKSVVTKLGAVIASAFAVQKIIQFGKESVQAANELSNALVGLQSILDGEGRSFSAAQSFIEDYTKDGLIPATNAITAYKNLAMRGYDDSQIQQVMVALKDASAFGRQASYTMGEAVESATEGLKNENSILVDNAGVTKNVAKMWEEYAASIGTTASNLTQEQKIQAEVNGILEESQYQAGDAAKVAGTMSGSITQLSFNLNNLKVAVGNAISPFVQSFIPVINSAVLAITRFANAIASVVGALFGKATVQTGALADENDSVASSAAAGAEAEEDLADATKAAASAAKKSLASFDELNVLQSNSGSSSDATDSSTSSSISSIVADVQVEDAISPKLQAIADKITELVEPLKNIDFSPAVAAFERLKEAIAPLTQNLFDGLEWAWNNILVPLATWTIEDALPASLDLLSAALDVLNSVIEALKPLGAWLWDNFLQPIAAWTGELFISALQEITDLLQKLADLISGEISFGEFLSNLTAVQTALVGIAASLATIHAISAGMTAFGAIAKGVSGLIASVNALNATGFIGKIGELIALFSGAAGPVTSFSEVLQVVFGTVATTIAGIGSVVGGSILAIANFISMLANGFDWLKEVLMVIGTAITAIGAIILGAPALVAGAVAAIVAAVATAIVLIKEHWAEICQFFTDLWQGIVDTWNVCAEWFDTNVIQPVAGFFSGLWEGISTAASDCWAAIVEFFTPSFAWFSELFGSVWQTISDIFYDIGVIASGCWEIIKACWAIVSSWFKTNIIAPVSAFFTNLWASIKNMAINAWNGIKSAFSAIGSWINANIIQPVSKFFANLWNGFLSNAKAAWEGVRSVFGTVASFFGNIFAEAWAQVVRVFSVAGDIFTDIKDGILSAFKSVVNGLIKGLNSAISVPFGGINSALQTIKAINILGITPFSGLKTISVPQIPYLAQGAVLPANKPFMAVVGDQKNGTNVEAPLTTIQEAVANVMDDQLAAMMAGFEAIVTRQEKILSAIESIEIGDRTIGQAAERYARKMAVLTGGTT